VANGTGSGDIDHVIERGQKKPGQVLAGVAEASGDRPGPDLLQLGGTREFLVGGF
jgi:hypothetical protein